MKINICPFYVANIVIYVFSVKSCFEPILVRTPVDYSGDHTRNKNRG